MGAEKRRIVVLPQALRLTVRYLLLLLAVVFLNFLIPRLLPGSPFSFSSGDGTDTGIALPATVIAQLQRDYRLDQPLPAQFAGYLADLARGELGLSIERTGQPVGQLIGDRLPWTFGLLGLALLIAVLCGTALGMIAGWLPGSLRDRVLISLTAAISAVPEFLIALALLLLFAITLRWFPLSGGQTLFADYGDSPTAVLSALLDIVWHLTLPAVALVLTGTAGFVLLARDLTSGLRNEQWLVTARAKGLAEWQIGLWHALPNIAPTLVTFFGLRLGGLLGGALVIERVFNLPGLGLLAFGAIRARDYPVLQALFLLSSAAILLANLAVELLYLAFDHKRESERG